MDTTSMIISSLDVIPVIIFKVGVLPWRVSKKARVLFIWVFVHCSGKEVAMMMIISYDTLTSSKLFGASAIMFSSCPFSFFFGFLIKLRQVFHDLETHNISLKIYTDIFL